MLSREIASVIRDVADFPKKGVIFKDITPIFLNMDLYNRIIDDLAQKFKDKSVTKVAAMEARGFLFGISLAQKLNVAFVPIRKKGKLPYETVSEDYQLEYGTASIEIHKDAVNENDNVLIIDDLLATGGTVVSSINLIKKLKGKVAGCAFVIELTFLNGKEKLKDTQYYSILKY